MTPNPGSPEAQDLGCTCPVLDNGRGRGCGRVDAQGRPLFWLRGDCSVHVNPPQEVIGETPNYL